MWSGRRLIAKENLGIWLGFDGQRAMTTNALRAAVEGAPVVIGSAIMEFDSPGIGHILKAAGCDFVFVDTEHSGWGIDTVKRTLRYMEAADLPAIVRPPSNAYHHIARSLDAGAAGLLLPMVESADEARMILGSMKYPPLGKRGAAFGIAHDAYAPGSVPEKMEAANADTVFLPLIESPKGVENAEEIAALDGVDVLWIGHFDLTATLGIPGRFDHPDYLAAVDEVVKAAQRHGKTLGRLVSSVEEGSKLYAQGFKLICYGTDIMVLQQGVQQGVSALRAACV